MTALVLLVAVGTVAAPAPAGPADPYQILERAVRERGTPDGVSAGYVQKAVGARSDRNPDGTAGSVIQTVTYTQGAVRSRLECRIVVGGQPGQIVYGTNEHGSWKGRPGEAPAAFPKPVQAANDESNYLTEVLLLFALTDRTRFRLESLPSGPDEDGVRVRSAGRPDIDLTFDRGTGLLKRAASARVTVEGEHIKTVRHFDEYKRFQGMAVATRERMTVAGEATVREGVVESVEFLPADQVGDLFVKP